MSSVGPVGGRLSCRVMMRISFLERVAVDDAVVERTKRKGVVAGTAHRTADIFPHLAEDEVLLARARTGEP